MKPYKNRKFSENGAKNSWNGKPIYTKPYKEPKIWGVNGIGEYWYGADDSTRSSTAVLEYDTCSLYDIVHHNPEEFLGDKVVSRYGKQLPLVKILTPKARLSVQFHDSKNELWIVTETDRVAAGGRPWIIIGFSQESVRSYGNEVTMHYKKSLLLYGDALNNLIDLLIHSGDEYLLNKRNDVALAAAEAARNRPGSSKLAKMRKELNTARERLDTFYNRQYVEPGDVVAIPSKTLHALGPGVQVVEPQISGPTQSLEDGSIYPIRYAFPGYPRKDTKRVLDIDRTGEMHSHVSEKMPPVILKETKHVIVERLPGGFEDKGLAVHRIRLERGAEFKQTLDSFHILVLTHGKAHLVIKDKKYEIPKALPDGQMLFVPASVKNYLIMATETAQIIDTFTPI
ncbi:MAG: hypothetical protein MRK01_11895 [Candidatus Scalindua sp.]|nr:hypothetical protein [Candidatus Scalindua sp.]